MKLSRSIAIAVGACLVLVTPGSQVAVQGQEPSQIDVWTPLPAAIISLVGWMAVAEAAAFAQERITATVGGVAASLVFVDATHAKLTAPAGIPSATHARWKAK